MSQRRPESEARVVISVMIVLTMIVVAFVAATSLFDTTGKSVILVAWMGVMMAVLRRYRL